MAKLNSPYQRVESSGKIIPDKNHEELMKILLGAICALVGGWWRIEFNGENLGFSLLSQHCAKNKGEEKAGQVGGPHQVNLCKTERSHAIWGHFLRNKCVGYTSFRKEIWGKRYNLCFCA